MNDLLKRIADLSPEKRGLLAQKLKGKQKVSAAAERIPRHNGSGDLPLSYAQQRLWFLDQLRPGDATYNIPAAVRLRGSLNVKAMEDALSEVVRRHEILRTTFPAVAAQPRQVIHSAQPIRLPVKSLMSLPEDLREEEVRRLARLNSSEPFDLAHGPLLRADLTQIGDEDYVLMFTIHHIISDGWSLGVMVREVGVLYEAFSKGETSPLPEMAIQYKDYAVWQQQPFHQELFAQQLEYWKKQLAGLHPTIDLSTRPRPPVQSFRGSVEEFELPEKLSQSILELGQREGATLFMTLLTAFSVLLHRYTGRNDLVVGTDVANRNSPDTEGLIGFFINQLIIRANTSGDPTFRELLRRLKDVALDGFANQELPFERLVAALQPERSLSYTPLFQVKLVVQNTPVEPISLHGLTLEPFSVHNGTVGFDLILTVAESTNKLQGSLEYNTDIFDAAAIQRLLGHYETILKSAVSDPEQRISQLPMLTSAERRQLLGDFNRSNTDLSAPVLCLHQLFEQQVASFPDHPALVAGSVQLSYSELNSRANQLAHYLRRLGVGAEVRVGLCVERSVEMVVGILGVLKAGGAYVPLDPQYPSERLSHMLEDAAVAVLLTQQHLLDDLPSVWSQIVCLDADHESIAQESTADPNVEVTPRNAAYVIYTSGSTGKPKGVVVEHHGIANLVRWQATNFNLTRESRISQFASYSFDAAVGETCMALLNGATLIMLERDELDSQALIEAVNRHRINVMVMVPSMIKALDVEALEHPEELTVVAVGEACQPELAQRWSRRCRFMNAYGPTEYTVYSHLWRVEPDLAAQTASVPIGFPISNTRTYILDEHLNPVPVGVTGEIYISGPGIARGYLNNPAHTAAKFLPNPFLVYEYFTDQGRLDASTANAEIREFKRNGYCRHPAGPATRLEWTTPISPPMIFKLIESLSPDLIRKTHSFIARHGQDSAVYGAFSRYLLEGIKGSYASCGINPEVLRRLLPLERFEGIQGVDFGFGNGEILKTLKGMGAHIKGLDFNPVFVQKARDNGLDAEMVKVDLLPAEFADISGTEPGTQDFVVSTLLMDRLSNPRNSLVNLFLVLKEGGRFAIQTLLPIVGVDDGEIEDPFTYTPEGALIVPGKTVEEDKEALICLLRKLGADEIEIFELPYVVMSRDGLQEYTVWSFTGVKNSFARQANSVEYYDTMYKTGDRGRFLPDGAIDFRGRVDTQVKIRGFRIEIGDIEAALSEHPDVNDCAVVARENAGGGQRLVAYVAADKTGIPSSELTSFLGQKLPDFMVPSAFLFLEQLPRLPNGKLNYDKLPPVETVLNRPAFVAPRTHVEQVLAEAWCQVLNLATVSIHDNIFELGGDSILILQILARLNQAGIHLTVNQFFKHQTIAQLAEANVATELQPVEQTLVSGDVELTPIQRWFFEQDLVDIHHYNQSVMLQAREALDARLLSETFRYLVAHHDALRLRFRQTEAGWEQFNAESSSHEVFTHQELTGMDESEMRQAVEKAASELQAGLNLSDGSLIKARLFSFGGRMPDCLLIVIHHLAVDGVSWRILLEDLHTVYGQLLSHEAAVLALKTTSWKTWAERLTNLASSPELDTDAAYWMAASLTKPAQLPVDFQDGENSEASVDSVQLTLTAEETQELLERTPKILRASMNEVILAGLSAAVSAWVGEGTVLVEMEGHGREDLFEGVDVSRTTGWFTSLYPVFLDCAQARNPLDALQAVKNTLHEIPRRGLSYGLLRYSSAKPEVVETLRAMPQAAISFNYLGQFDQVLNESVLFDRVLDSAGSDHSPRQQRKYALEVISFIATRQLHLSIRFSRLLHRRSTVESLTNAMVDFLRTLLTLSREQLPAALSPGDFPLAQKALAKLDRQALADLLRKEGPVENIYPLTPMQQGMLYHSLSALDSGVYVNQMSCELRGDLNVAAFREAWKEVLRRHSVFRTSFTWGTLVEPLAIVHEQSPLEFAEGDWRSFSETEQNAKLIAYMETDLLRGFDLTKAPLTRIALLRTADDTYRFVWTFHHLLLDGWSVYLVIKEVFKFYEDLYEGSLTRLEPAVPYARYIAWLAKQNMAKAEAFWRRTLQGAPSPLPVRNLATTFKSERGRFGQHRIKFSAERTAMLQRLVREHRLTLNTLIQGTWALLESRYTNSDDVIFGAVVSGRPASLDGVEEMVGLFINTLPVRVRISGDALLLDWLHALQSQQVEASEYEYSPLMQIQAWSDVPGGVPLFNSILAFENYPIDDSLSTSSERLNIRKVVSVEQTNYPITVLAGPGEELSVGIVFDESKFDRPTIERMMDHFSMLLESIADNPDQPLSRLPLLSGREQRTLLHDWNDTATELPATQTIHGLFELQAARTPENLAASSAGERLNYRELNERANRLAHFLRRVGVRRGALVGVCLARSVEMLVAVLGVLKAGAAYVPLDPGYPAERLRLMVEDSGMRVLVAQGEEEWAQAVGSLERVVDVVREREQIGKEDSRAPEVEVTGEDAAYVIYTSGSTGKPKGVVGLHAGAVNRFNWMWKAYPFEDSEICCQKTSLSFLDSLWEMFGPVLQGVPTVIIPDEVVKDPVRLVATLAESQVTRIVLVPSLLRVLLEAFTNLGSRLPRLKYWVSSGEALPLDLQRRFHEVIPAGRLLNLYGSSEVSADVTYHETSALDPLAEGGLIGRPIANTQIYILNRDMKPVPLGVPGDLYVGGLNLARGYLHKSDLTAEKFVPDPYSGEVGARLYHTGDIACYLPDGNIEYLGRIDHQVKVRGFRVELGDVEAALREHGAIRQALVAAREDEPGNRRLVAYYVCSNGQAPQDGELRGFLQLKLQEFMIPSAFIQLEEFPLTPNGKVNRLALPVPGKSYPNKNKPFNAPRTHVEKSISEIWQEVLGLDQVSVDDNFFHLGGQSLLIIRVQSLLKERLNVDRPVAELFKYPTISALAASIAGETAQRSHVQSQERGKRRKARRRFASKVS